MHHSISVSAFSLASSSSSSSPSPSSSSSSSFLTTKTSTTNPLSIQSSPSSKTSTSSSSSSSALYTTNANTNENADSNGTTSISHDLISTPTSLMEEQMLAGNEQSHLVQLEEIERQTIWKQLEKDAKVKARKNKYTTAAEGNNKGSGFGGGGFGGSGAGKKKKQKTSSGRRVSDKIKDTNQITNSSNSNKQNDDDDQNHMEFDLKHDDKYKFGSVIIDRGVARINDRLSHDTASLLLDFINEYLNEALTTNVQEMPLEEIYKQQPYFADVREKLNRWDILLPFFIEKDKEGSSSSSNNNNRNGSIVQKALRELLVRDTVLSDTIESILGSASAQLYELGALISDPGSERQLLHADYNYQPDFQPLIPPALTCFIALQPIEENMGPTTFIPASATEQYHNEIAIGQYDGYGSDNDSERGSRSELLSTSMNSIALLRTGDCALYNPMTLHCGNANRSQKRRVIFYFSFKNKKYNEKDWPLAYASLRPDLRSRSLSLTEIQQIVSTPSSIENEK